MSALSSRTAHEREPSATATADVRTHARMRVSRASCGFSRAGAQRHRHVGAFWAIGGFVVLRAPPPYMRAFATFADGREGAFCVLKKHHPCVSLVKLRVGFLASRPASALVSGIATEFPPESPPTTARVYTRPFHGVLALGTLRSPRRTPKNTRACTRP